MLINYLAVQMFAGLKLVTSYTDIRIVETVYYRHLPLWILTTG